MRGHLPFSSLVLRGFLGGNPLPVRPPAPYSRAALRERADLPAAAGSAGGNDGLRLSPGDDGDVDGADASSSDTGSELRERRQRTSAMLTDRIAKAGGVASRGAGGGGYMYQYDGARIDAKIDAALQRVQPAGGEADGTWSGREQTMRGLSRIPRPQVPSPLRPRKPASGDVEDCGSG